MLVENGYSITIHPLFSVSTIWLCLVGFQQCPKLWRIGSSRPSRFLCTGMTRQCCSPTPRSSRYTLRVMYFPHYFLGCMRTTRDRKLGSCARTIHSLAAERIESQVCEEEVPGILVQTWSPTYSINFSCTTRRERTIAISRSPTSLAARHPPFLSTSSAISRRA